jgi:transcriptional regulator GlxA family with amidase domain
MRDIVVLLFHDFETLDACGPLEIFGRLTDHFRTECYSMEGGIVTSAQHVRIETRPLSEFRSEQYTVLIPGGIGVRNLLHNDRFLQTLTTLSYHAEYVLTVCTGSILFSKTGMLDGKRATSNKRMFAWTWKESLLVHWIKQARWVRDGNIYTSSGVSAGMDMTLAFISDLLGPEIAQQQSNEIEYLWNRNPGYDPFSELYNG